MLSVTCVVVASPVMLNSASPRTSSKVPNSPTSAMFIGPPPVPASFEWK